MKWEKHENNQRLPIKSWCDDIEAGALQQAVNLANHPITVDHVALMPDCHQGYGMPIGGVIACRNGVIPNAVGVDIGCGMGAVETDYPADKIENKQQIRHLINRLKDRIPVGEGHAHTASQHWKGFSRYLLELTGSEDLPFSAKEELPGWLTEKTWNLAHKNLGTLGGGNHFIELQKSDEGQVWLMLHSGSRNMGYKIANHYHNLALNHNREADIVLPDEELAYFDSDSEEGKNYIRDMNFALEYAEENRRRMMTIFKQEAAELFEGMNFIREINIHHNYAALETISDQPVWVHRKGATSAKKDEWGIIPGSMGTRSYIVKGKGTPDSFMSCSHGAGRKMSRMAASKTLTVEECNTAMEGIVFDRWSRMKSRKGKSKKNALLDLSEAPGAYKDINEVIKAELDLVDPIVSLTPLGVLKG